MTPPLPLPFKGRERVGSGELHVADAIDLKFANREVIGYICEI